MPTGVKPTEAIFEPSLLRVPEIPASAGMTAIINTRHPGVGRDLWNTGRREYARLCPYRFLQQLKVPQISHVLVDQRGRDVRDLETGFGRGGPEPVGWQA
jgi:hypothetical protein